MKAREKNPEIQFVLYSHKPIQTEIPTGCSLRIFTGQIKIPGTLWYFLILPILVRKDVIDIFWAPYPLLPFGLPRTIVKCVHVLDLAYKVYPKCMAWDNLFLYSLFAGYSIHHADILFAISKHTANDVVRYFDIPEERIQVTYLALPSCFKKDAQDSGAAKKLGYNEPYMLFVGTLEPRKNVDLLVKAYIAARARFAPACKLIIAGRHGWKFKMEYSQDYLLQQGVIFNDSPSDADLRYLYQNATLFVFPSLYEGFGIPLLEAMAYGCPILSSNASCLPEIALDGAAYFDPKNEDDLKEKMIELINSKTERELLVSHQEAVLSRYRWDISTDIILREFAKHYKRTI